MADYPDWQQVFRLVATEITIPISIETSAVTLNVSIASAVTLDVDITAQTVGNLAINLAASAITLDVNLAAQTANINISFEDQSVAVFDAAKWFAHQALMWYATGTGNVANNAIASILSRTVPAGKTAFILGMAWGPYESITPNGVLAEIRRDGIDTMRVGSYRGGSIIFDVPIRAVAGVVITMWVQNQGSGATDTFAASMWGYDEAV